MPRNIDNLPRLFDSIAPARAMQISVLSFSDGTLRLTAPLEPNQNDKGTAFAGSISSLLALTGWGVITLQLREAGISADVALAKSTTDFKRPVRAKMVTEALLKSVDSVIEDLKKTQRGRIQLEIRLYSQKVLCAVMTAQYAVFPGGTS